MIWSPRRNYDLQQSQKKHIKFLLPSQAASNFRLFPWLTSSTLMPSASPAMAIYVAPGPLESIGKALEYQLEPLQLFTIPYCLCVWSCPSLSSSFAKRLDKQRPLTDASLQKAWSENSQTDTCHWNVSHLMRKGPDFPLQFPMNSIPKSVRGDKDLH